MRAWRRKPKCALVGVDLALAHYERLPNSAKQAIRMQGYVRGVMRRLERAFWENTFDMIMYDSKPLKYVGMLEAREKASR